MAANNLKESKDKLVSTLNQKIKSFVKKYPKEIFYTGFGLLTLSLIFTFAQLYTYEDRERIERYVHPESDINEVFKEKQLQQMEGLGNSFNAIRDLQNPFALYSQMGEIEALNRRIQIIQQKEIKTTKDSLELLAIYETIKQMTNE